MLGDQQSFSSCSLSREEIEEVSLPFDLKLLKDADLQWGLLVFRLREWKAQEMSSGPGCLNNTVETCASHPKWHPVQLLWSLKQGVCLCHLGFMTKKVMRKLMLYQLHQTYSFAQVFVENMNNCDINSYTFRVVG